MIVTAALSLTTYIYAACWGLEPRSMCTPNDQAPVAGAPPTGNYCQAFVYHPHGTSQYCLDVSSVEGADGADNCVAGAVTTYEDYIWLQEGVGGHCLDNNNKFEIDNLMIGSCEEDYFPESSNSCS